MKATSLLCALLALIIGAYPAATQTKVSLPATYLITGVVVSSADGSPIQHCHLTATLVPRGSGTSRQFPAPVGTFDADEHGRFSISLPSAGMWRLTASARGYVTQAYEEHESFSSGIVLTPAAPAVDLRFQLSPEGIIAGRVLDEAGEAVRNARVSLLELPPTGPDSIQSPARMRNMTTTDDRGSYEFDELPPGDYRINVQAQVWYAVAARPQRFDSTGQPPPDPSLDVVYPLSWYPGTSDPALAETIHLQAGDSRQADFQLLPIPSVHLRILPMETTVDGRRVQSYPMIERISSNGDGGFVPVSARPDADGGIEVSGLAPGEYEVRMGEPRTASKPAIIEAGAGSVQTLNMNDSSDIASVSIRFDGIPETEGGSVQVNFIDAKTGRVAARSGARGYIMSGGLLRQREKSPADRVVEVPPGRYEVVLAGRSNLYLAGITAQSAAATGRYVTVSGGDSSLILHVGKGRATLNGVARSQGKPAVGAMVLLVPTTLGDPAGLNIIRRDQTNTDGSYDLDDVLPGQYILIAIDHGWQINWRDASTLRDYMMHGVPVDLTSSAVWKQDIEAQMP